MKTKLNKTFIIVNTLTKEKWESTSGKSSWKQSGHAKSAFYHSNRVYFDTQNGYELVELKPEAQSKLDRIELLVSIAEDWCKGQEIDLTDGQVCISAMKDIRRILKEK